MMNYMTKTPNYSDFINNIKENFKGEFYNDEIYKIIYSTDSSVYKEKPSIVCYPKDKADLLLLVNAAKKNNISLISRTAGTSLAGQVVGSGVIVDFSKHLTKIIEVNKEKKTVKLEPGVILDVLNYELKKSGLFFGPETSTSNRCMIGGMIGNNSCGANSLIYGSVRDHLLSVDAILADGSEVTFSELTKEEFFDKMKLQSLEGEIYCQIYRSLVDKNNKENIINEYPDKEIKRRNTGYAIDILLDTEIFSDSNKKFNFSKLIAGSEGTLAIITSATLNLVSLPPENKTLVCVHLNSVAEALEANLIALTHKPTSVELMDKTILELTKENKEQNKNRFFINGNPGAILIVEFAEHQNEIIESKIKALTSELKAKNLGFHFPEITGSDIPKVWALRKAGLGVLSNMPGDLKPVAVIEDTAISPTKLPSFISDFEILLKKLNLQCVYYAHIGTGELHLRPVLNLKDSKHIELFKTIAYETAILVKKYRGSLSGEHGDGRLRGEFLQLMIGKENYELLKQIKFTWDKNSIFNRNKIVDTPPMHTFLRYAPNQITRNIETIFDFSNEGGLLRAIEKCNGSADCRKTQLSGGTMCPSYMATLDEKNSTRARANILREFLTHSTKKNIFAHKEIMEVLDLCLSCKACKSECPSNVDMTKFKTEFLQHYYEEYGVPLRSRVVANISDLNKIGMLAPSLYNFFMQNRIFSSVLKSIIGFTKERSLPVLPKQSLRKWAEKEIETKNNNFSKSRGELILFIDEFSNYSDFFVGQTVIELLLKLNYHIKIVKHYESGRAAFSKGLLRKAKNIAMKNIDIFAAQVNENCPLVGIEPSAILSFRDEYLSLSNEVMLPKAKKIAQNSFLLEEFIVREFKAGKIKEDDFSNSKMFIKMHGHCHQKSLSEIKILKEMLEIPKNSTVTEIKSGCCGMAGSFGYEKEHYLLSMQIGELVLFPEIRATSEEFVVVAPGTSCREQIFHGTGKYAVHPAEVLLRLLKWD